MEINKHLGRFGIKTTKARHGIVKVLYSAKSPLNYDQILARMELEIDKATFYRNMALFESNGMVNKFESDDRKWYYELTPSNHAHFICESCHSVQCTDMPLPSNVDGKQITSAILKGRCEKCEGKP
jgi:Fur family ferric uptake transcriptional regulator